MQDQVQRKMFESHVAFAVVRDLVFAKGHNPGIGDALGYLYVDKDTGNLCWKVEHVYAEINPDFMSHWRAQVAGLVSSR